jgi:rod shape-determining protein MreC
VASGGRGNLLLTALLCAVSVSLYCLPEEHKHALASRFSPLAFAPGLAVARQAEALLSVGTVNRTLRTRLANLALENFNLRELREENRRLRALLSLKESSSLRLKAVRVTGRTWTPLGLNLVLEEGEADGIVRYTGLMTHDGLVGKVSWAGPLYATAQTLLEKDCRVSVLIARTRVPGVLAWVGGNTLEIRDVPLEADVQEGDSVVTSGFGGVFPKGILVGSVVKIGRDRRVPLMQVRVSPAVDFRKVEEVFMLEPAEREPPSTATE